MLGTGELDIPDQTQEREGPDEKVRGVKFPKSETRSCAFLVEVVIVVPAFSKSEKSNPPTVFAVLRCFKRTVPKLVSRTVHKPCHMVDQNEANKYPPECCAHPHRGPKQKKQNQLEDSQDPCLADENKERVAVDVASKFLDFVRVVKLLIVVDEPTQMTVPKAASRVVGVLV